MTVAKSKSILVRLFAFFVRTIFFSSLPAWVLLSVSMIVLAIIIPQSEVDKFREALSHNAWLLTKPFFPDWFALSCWVLFFWVSINFFIWLIRHYFNSIKFIANVPYLSLPFLILTAAVSTIYVGYDSDYVKKIYTPHEHYVRSETAMKSMREQLNTDNPTDPEYEKIAQRLPVRSRVRGQTWQIPEAVLSRFTSLSYQYTGGRYKNETINYRLHIPENIDTNKKYPLLLWLHGVGECGKDNISQLAHMEPLVPLITGEKQRQFFILATQCPADNKMWDTSKSKDDEKGDANMAIAVEVLDDVIKNYPVDSGAISVFGISSGGYGVMSIAMKYKGRFATLIPVACNPHKNLHECTVKYNTAIWMFNNTGDKDIVFRRIEEEVKTIHENNGIAFSTSFNDKGHHAWRHALLCTPLIDWILWYQRNPSLYKPPYRTIISQRTGDDFFKLFILPFYISGTLMLLPLLILATEKNHKLPTKKHKK
jgi:predicted esterase